MYESRQLACAPGGGLAWALPKFLTPPRVVRDYVGGIVGAVTRGTTVEIPNVGTFNLGNPDDVARLKAIASGAAGVAKGIKVRVATPQAGPTPYDFGRAAGSPAGIAVIAAVGLGLFLFSRRRG